METIRRACEAAVKKRRCAAIAYTLSMRYRSVLVFTAGLVAIACRSGPAPASSPPHPVARRVVAVSFDGLAGERHARLQRAGAYRDPDGLGAFTGGLVVARALPVNPTLTSPSHIAIATGLEPSRTGIVANRFHLPGTPITETVSGFDYPIGAETIWESVRRQGRRVGSLAYPGCNGPDQRRRADFGMDYVQRPLLRAATLQLSRNDFVTRSGAPGGGDAPPASTTLSLASERQEFPGQWTFVLTALDTVADGAARYDTVVVDDDQDSANGRLATVKAGQWFAVRWRLPHPDGGTALAGGWWVVRQLAPDLSRVELYRGELNCTEAYPRAFREALDEHVGFWPGAPDSDALGRGVRGSSGLAPEEYLAQVRRFSEYFTAAAQLAIAQEEFHLLLAYQPIIDEVQHTWLFVDPRQGMYSPGLSATGGRIIDETYRLADRATGQLARSLDLRQDALVVFSDHGIAPVWEAVHLNEALRRAGLAVLAEGTGKPRVGAASRIVAVGSGGCAHLYVNLIGREPTGVVAPDQRDQVVGAAARALARLEVDGEPVIEAMFPRSQLAEIGLDHPHSGDLVVFLRPGYGATAEIGGALSTPATVAGQHGFRNTHPEMAGVWLARGAGVPGQYRRRAPLTQVAPFLSRLLGLAPPGGPG